MPKGEEGRVISEGDDVFYPAMVGCFPGCPGATIPFPRIRGLFLGKARFQPSHVTIPSVARQRFPPPPYKDKAWWEAPPGVWGPSGKCWFYVNVIPSYYAPQILGSISGRSRRGGLL